MPAVIEVTTDGIGLPVTTTRGIGIGMLNGASVFLPTGAAGQGDIWAEIGVLNDQAVPGSISAVLASGYVSRSRPLIWQGLFALGPGNGVYLRYISLAVVPVRATFRTGSG